MTNITAETATATEGMMEAFGRSAFGLACKANGTTTPTDDQLERAGLVLATAMLENREVGPDGKTAAELFATALAYTVGRDTGAVRVAA